MKCPGCHCRMQSTGNPVMYRCAVIWCAVDMVHHVILWRSIRLKREWMRVGMDNGPRRYKGGWLWTSEKEAAS